jgi:ketosteroid isomerase-like protein
MRIGVAVLTLALVLPAGAQSKGGAAVESLVAAERAFARMSLETSTKDAFVANFADESVLFRPYPVAGKKFMEEAPASQGLLTWDPSVAELSTAGDLGWTTGPWEWREKRSLDTPAAAHGFYVSLWRRQPDGRFRVVFDHGTSNPAPAERIAPWDAKTVPPAPARLSAGAPDAARAALAETDDALSKVISEKGAAAGLGAYLADDGRLHRDGVMPRVGKKAVLAALDAKPAGLTWSRAGVDVAASSDLGYTYGTTKSASGDEQAYMRIWRVVSSGSWKVVLDIVTPIAKPKA